MRPLRRRLAGGFTSGSLGGIVRRFPRTSAALAVAELVGSQLQQRFGSAAAPELLASIHSEAISFTVDSMWLPMIGKPARRYLRVLGDFLRQRFDLLEVEQVLESWFQL